ncbi:hypothetical protein DI272_37075 [Streptomyces sp. Act143]|uniref:hypothetical protein n=1 Tax=Streptomyces sp. Act143 TaxID=2200760 RepID=UPI000D679D14|nr:hypothetical protein [Streptomyces sp. Act143]PWI19143.1 hypothetical protein DI272_37075 [Streptomyces sp. Act143]
MSSRSLRPLLFPDLLFLDLLFLNVDGPLNPYAAKPERRPEGCTTIRVTLHPGAGLCDVAERYADVNAPSAQSGGTTR